MSPLLILAILFTLCQGGPARQKREAEECSLESFDIESDMFREMEDMINLVLMKFTIPWEDLENFSLRNTTLEMFSDRTSQETMNYFLAMWSKELEASITKNVGSPYEENLIFSRKLTTEANGKFYESMSDMSTGLTIFDMGNIEVHRYMSNHSMIQEMVETMKYYVLIGQGISHAMVDWEIIHQMLDCSEGYLNNNDTAVMKALHSIKVDPKECLGKARRLVDSLERVAKSSDLHMAPSILMKAGISFLEALEVDELWSAVYNVILHLRGHLLQTDWNSVVTGVLDGCSTACTGYWKLTTGQWPELENYIQQLLAEMQKDGFWERLDKLYMTLVMEAKSMLSEESDMNAQVKMVVHKQLMPMCTMVVNAIEKASNEIKPSFSELSEYIGKLIRKFPSYMIHDGIKMIPKEIESMIFMLPTSNLVCYSKDDDEDDKDHEDHEDHKDDEGMPLDAIMMPPWLMAMLGIEEDDLLMPSWIMAIMGIEQEDSKKIEENTPRMQELENVMMLVNETLGDLFFSDWQEGRILPEGLDNMCEMMKASLWEINSALVSPYCKHQEMDGESELESDLAEAEAEPESEPESEPDKEN